MEKRFNIDNVFKEMRGFARQAKRGQKALQEFMLSAFELLKNHSDSFLKKIPKSKEEPERSIVEYFFSLSDKDTEADKSRRRMYIRALKNLLKNAKDKKEANQILSDKGIYKLSRLNNFESVSSEHDDTSKEKSTTSNPPDIATNRDSTIAPSKSGFRALLEERGMKKKHVICFKMDGKYVAVANEDIWLSLLDQIKKNGSKAVELFPDD